MGDGRKFMFEEVLRFIDHIPRTLKQIQHRIPRWTVSKPNMIAALNTLISRDLIVVAKVEDGVRFYTLKEASHGNLGSQEVAAQEGPRAREDHPEGAAEGRGRSAPCGA